MAAPGLIPNYPKPASEMTEQEIEAAELAHERHIDSLSEVSPLFRLPRQFEWSELSA